MNRPNQQGFTLIELILSLSILAALVAIAFVGLRVGLGAWRQGEDRAEVQQHARSLREILERSVGSAYPYRDAPVAAVPPVILFEGSARRISFVTIAPPLPPSVPIAFTAVTLSVQSGATPGLAVSQKALPNTEPFAAAPVLVDASVADMSLRYQREDGTWGHSWNGATERALPRAVEVALTTKLGGRVTEQPPLLILVRTTMP